MNKIMVLKGGSPAIHKLGDLGRKEDNFIKVSTETDTHYIGSFVEGFGFFNVEFKKEDCRLLTIEEKNKLSGSWWGINDNPIGRLFIDEEGNIIKSESKMIHGTIFRITNLKGESKKEDWIGLGVSFYDDVQVGQNLVLFIDNNGTITTTRITNLGVSENKYMIHTENTIYHILV